MADDKEKSDARSGEKKPFFSISSDNSTASYADSEQGPGGKIGPYKLLSILGEGGYGIVYLAEQQKPVRRQVALKIIKPGMDTKQVIARFEAERQALALLDHQNIATIHDAGTTMTGRLYFVMELVHGVPITEHCDRQKSSIEERLELFSDICDAIQYAHQKGIIHRDIKPSNILVSIDGERVTLKVIDFGIAKAISQPLTERTLYTEQGLLIGTPEYMSPEQAEMTNQDIDTRSDVYSLGVVLYELLTGVLPFDPETLREAGIDRLRQIIREQEPKTPSTRLSHLGEKAEQIAVKRRTEIRTLARRLHKELEWIPMKAMRKERIRRYRSVSELADDIQNYINGNPLIAGPESITYKLNKYVRKHRRFVTAAAVVATAVLVGFVVSTTMYFRAEDARTTEAKQRKVADTERDRATEAEKQALRRLVDSYERQGRVYMESGDLDKALVVLSEAYNVDNQRLSVRFLLAECMRKHENPVFWNNDGLIPWSSSSGRVKGSAFSVSPDRKFIALMDESLDCIHVCDTNTGKVKVQFPCNNITQLVFTPGSQYIIVKAAEDSLYHTLKAFDIQESKEVFSIKRTNVDIDKLYESVDYALPDRGQIKEVYDSICMSPDGDWFAFIDVVNLEGELKPKVSLWDFKAGKLCTIQSKLFSSLISGMIFRPKSAYGHPSALCTLDCNDLCQCWDVPTLSPAGQFFYYCEFAIFGSNGKRHIQFEGQEVELFDRARNARVMLFQNTIWAGFSPDGRRIVTKQTSVPSYDTSGIEGDFSTNLWDAEDGRHIAQLAGKELKNWHFSPDSKYLVTVHADGQLKVWNVEDGRSIHIIAPEEKQTVTDISPDNCWLLTCNNQQPSTIKVWNLITGDLFEPYQDEALEGDIAGGWLRIDNDRIFSFFHHPPKRLARFNADGTCLITRSGLWNFMNQSQRLDQIRGLVEAYIPLRLENGKIRSVSSEEMLSAKLDYCVLTKGKQNPETIASMLDLAVYEIQAGELEKASELTIELKSLQPLVNADFTQGVRDVIYQLSKSYSDRADREHRRGKYAEAITDYESALRFDENDPLTLKELAWLQATCPDNQLLNVDKAIEGAMKVCELTNWKHWECLSIHAVACAAGGEFENAINFQQKSIELLPADKRDKWQANYQERLRLFQSNQPYNRSFFWNLPTNNMIAWWKFNQTKGSDVVDSSGNGFSGKFVGAARIVEDAERSNVLRLDGQSSYVDCGNNSAFDITDSITVVAWIKVGVFDKESQAIVSKGESAWRLQRNWMNDTLSFNCDGLQGFSTPGTSVGGKVNVNDGKWHHVTATYNGTMLTLYLDGVLENYNIAQGEIDTNAFPLWIGGNAARTGKRGREWNGLIDDVRIYNRALSADEIAELYSETK